MALLWSKYIPVVKWQSLKKIYRGRESCLIDTAPFNSCEIWGVNNTKSANPCLKLFVRIPQVTYHVQVGTIPGLDLQKLHLVTLAGFRTI